MARRKRTFELFNLSFLDVMSCGFGAVILLFLMIKHHPYFDAQIIVDVSHEMSEVNMLEEEVKEGQANLAKIRNTISEVDDELAVAQGLASRIMEDQRETAALTEELIAGANSVELDGIKARIQQLEKQKKQIEQDLVKSGEDARRTAGQGRQQYLTGLRMEGNHLLILLDTSASMLDDTIVNVVRFRNMRDELKRNAEKWRRTLRIVEWLTARFPITSQYQVYTFNEQAGAALAGSNGQWLNVKDSVKLKSTIDSLKTLVPEGGTNLEKVFALASQLRPQPDAIFLITDGLPTQGTGAPGGTTISSKDRLKLFARSIKELPARVPINVILTPLEGDPDASPALWRLARASNGSFMSPSQDWP